MSSASFKVEKSYDDPFVILYTTDVYDIMQKVRPTAVCVFLALATHANRKQDNSCYPSFETLAREAKVSRRTVVSAIQELEAAEIITVEARIDPEFGQKSNLYFLNRTRGAKSAPPSADFIPGGGTKLAPPPVQNLHPNHMNLEPDEKEPYVGEDESHPEAKPNKKSSTVPESFVLSDRIKEWGSKDGFTHAMMEYQIPQFVDHWTAKGDTRKDWDATFRTWMRNAREWNRLGPSKGGLTVHQGGKVGRDGRTDDERGYRENPGPKGWSADEMMRIALDLERSGT